MTRKLISLRVSPEELGRADALMPPLAEHTELRAVRVTRSVVLRLALQRGLDALEDEHGTAGHDDERRPDNDETSTG